MTNHLVFLGLGSNLGDREENIREAIARIAEQIGAVEAQSAIYYSEPWGFDSSNTFVNAVVRIKTSLTPHRLLRATQRIERQLGKTAAHATERNVKPIYHDRPIDIDILLYDDLTINEPNLVVPHPRMHERPFVMEPLKEVEEDKKACHCENFLHNDEQTGVDVNAIGCQFPSNPQFPHFEGKKEKYGEMGISCDFAISLKGEGSEGIEGK